MDKIKVFVSSAMRAELGGTLDWQAIRSGIARKLHDSEIFGVFVIEDHASAEPSNQYMLSQVSECSVYLLILGHELRDGTRQEYQKALELHKDMLVYVYDVQHDDRCAALINEIKKNDYCCYQTIKVADDIGTIVASGLREHVISRYRGRTDMKALKSGDQGLADSIPRSIESTGSFGTAVTLLGKRLGYSYGRPIDAADGAPLSKLGDNLIGWLLEGNWTLLHTYEEAMAKELSEAGINQNDIKLLQLRWRACDLYMSGNTNAAIQVLEKAATQGKDKTQILTGILIDLRNLVIKRDGVLASRKYQDDIDARGANSYVPVGVTFTNAASSTLQEARDAEWLISERTIVFGEHRLSSALLSTSKSLFVNALYGSIAGIESRRIDCAKLLMSFSRIYDDRSLYVEGLRICALGNHYDELEKWLDAGFDFANQEIVSHADELWDASCVGADGAINECGCVVFATLGMYFNDARFAKASRAVLDGVNSFGAGAIGATKYAKAISLNAYRMNPGLLVHIIVALIEGRRIDSAKWLNSAIRETRLEDASKEDRVELALALEEHYAWLIERGFSSSCVALLARKHKEFSKLGALVKNRLNGTDLIEYELNERDEPTVSATYVIGLLREARTQLIENDDPKRQSDFGTRPAKYLSTIISAQSLPTICEAVKAEFSELWKQVANSGAPGSVLDDYVWLAINMVVAYQDAALPLPNDYKALARALKNKQPPIDSGFHPYERKAWIMRVATYRLLVGVGKKRAFLDAISDVWGSGISAREVCAECLRSYLQANSGVAFRDVATIVSVLNVLSRDKDAQVRQKAVGCATKLLNSSASDHARSILLRLAHDPRPGVRIQLLREDVSSTEHADMLRELARYLTNDAHFGVRCVAHRVAQRIDQG